MRSLPRALLLILLILLGFVLAGLLRLDRHGRLSRERLAQWWHRRLLHLLNVRVNASGRPAPGAQLIVANHVSWLDIPVLAALTPARFVAKAEIRHWPIAGALAEACGTFYLQRGKGGSAPLLNALVPHLRAGGAAVLFPEGTTTDGTGLTKPFHARLFAAAIEGQCAVQPAALSYARDGEGRSVAPFVGDDDLLSHLLRLLREPEIHVDVEFCPALMPISAGRDMLAQAAERSVRQALTMMQRRPQCACSGRTRMRIAHGVTDYGLGRGSVAERDPLPVQEAAGAERKYLREAPRCLAR